MLPCPPDSGWNMRQAHVRAVDVQNCSARKASDILCTYLLTCQSGMSKDLCKAWFQMIGRLKTFLVRGSWDDEFPSLLLFWVRAVLPSGCQAALLTFLYFYCMYMGVLPACMCVCYVWLAPMAVKSHGTVVIEVVSCRARDGTQILWVTCPAPSFVF